MVDVITALNVRLTHQRSELAVICASVTILILTSIVIGSQFPSWKRQAGNLIAFQQLSQDKALCGVALLGIAWYDSGGYTYLHRNVPLYVLPGESELKVSDRSFNAIVAPSALPTNADGFERLGCWDGVCVYKRDGICEQSNSAYEINETLRRTDR